MAGGHTEDNENDLVTQVFIATFICIKVSLNKWLKQSNLRNKGKNTKRIDKQFIGSFCAVNETNRSNLETFLSL